MFEGPSNCTCYSDALVTWVLKGWVRPLGNSNGLAVPEVPGHHSGVNGYLHLMAPY